MGARICVRQEEPHSLLKTGIFVSIKGLHLVSQHSPAGPIEILPCTGPGVQALLNLGYQNRDM